MNICSSKNKGKNKSRNKKNELMKIPKSVQDTIPYYAVYPDNYASGVIETHPGFFTISFLMQDLNYHTSKTKEQETIFKRYGEFINSFDSNVRFQICINNKNIDMNEFKKKALLAPTGDVYDKERKIYNSIISAKMREGKNNMKKEKYITIEIEADDIDTAIKRFARIESDVSAGMKKIGSPETRRLSSIERLEILYDIFNIGSEGKFLSRQNIPANQTNGGKQTSYFDFNTILERGLTTKDIIGPESFEFKSNYMKIGDKYCRVLYVKTLPSFMYDTFVDSVTDTGCNMLMSINMYSLSPAEAAKIIKRKLIDINADMIKRQKSASKAGYSIELISPELKSQQEETIAFMDDITSKDQKMFVMNMLIAHFAGSLDELDSDTQAIQSAAGGIMVDIKPFTYMQELGFDSVLPLAYNRIRLERTLTTETMAVFMPFSSQDLMQRNGMYYGLNAVSKNVILYNRSNLRNGNGFILGIPGSGKSFAAKLEMLMVLLAADADVIVIDPEGEYYPMIEMLRGEIVRIAIGSDKYINPLDIDMHTDKTKDDPMSIKSDFIISLCETAAADKYGISAAQRSIIDRCVKKIYEPYISSYDPETDSYDESKIPTLLDLQDALESQPGYEAKQLADSMEMYTRGSLNIFSHRTNVSYNNRFVVYDIKDIGTNLKGMGLLVILDSIWNRMVANRDSGRETYFYIDEVYLLFKNDTSAEFLRNLYKRARKYGGIPTGITQNITDMLDSDIAKTMIQNSEFLLLMNQSEADAAEIAILKNISDTQLEYIKNSGIGEGLLCAGSSIIPFINKIPEDNEIYRAMTTKLSESAQRDKNKGDRKQLWRKKINT